MRRPSRGRVIAARSNIPGSTCGTFYVVECDGKTLRLESPVGTRLSVPWVAGDWHDGTSASDPLFSAEAA